MIEFETEKTVDEDKQMGRFERQNEYLGLHAVCCWKPLENSGINCGCLLNFSPHSSQFSLDDIIYLYVTVTAYMTQMYTFILNPFPEFTSMNSYHATA